MSPDSEAKYMARKRSSDFLKTSLADILDGRISFPGPKPIEWRPTETETTPKSQGKCRVCGGDLIKRFRQNGSIMDARIGGPPVPRARDGYHCGTCGIKYAFVATQSEENP